MESFKIKVFDSRRSFLEFLFENNAAPFIVIPTGSFFVIVNKDMPLFKNERIFHIYLGLQLYRFYAFTGQYTFENFLLRITQ